MIRLESNDSSQQMTIRRTGCPFANRHPVWRVVICCYESFDLTISSTPYRRHLRIFSKSLANWLPVCVSAANRLPVWRFVNCLWRFAAVWVYWTTLERFYSRVAMHQKKNVMSTQRARFSKFVFRSFSMVGLSRRLRNIWHVPVKFLFTFEIISAGHFNEINIILNLLSVINGIGSSCTDAACDSVACALWRLNRWSRRRLDVPRTHIVIGWFFCFCLQHRWSNFDLLSLMLRMDDVTINNLPCYHIKKIDSVLPWVSTRSHKPSKCNFLVLNTFWRHLSFIADHEQTHGNTGWNLLVN